jgi:hypothetical protein
VNLCKIIHGDGGYALRILDGVHDHVVVRVLDLIPMVDMHPLHRF